MADDLPRQLSTQQRFILAHLLVESRRATGADPAIPFSSVSEATAVELDDDGSRVDRTARPSSLLTSRHTSSFSRAVDSLEDRGLVEAERGEGSRRPRRVALRLTPDGRTAAEELHRRHHDGRYALEFSTLEID